MSAAGLIAIALAAIAGALTLGFLVGRATCDDWWRGYSAARRDALWAVERRPRKVE